MSPTNLPNPIPFSEPPYLRGLPSPYYTEGHLRFQKACRAFLWENLISHATEWEKAGQVPDHMARSGLAGPGTSLSAGFAFGIPPVLKYASRELQERMLPDMLTGRKRTCIAITEPEAGSDVANITTTRPSLPMGSFTSLTGRRSGMFYVPGFFYSLSAFLVCDVFAMLCFGITNGIWSDYTTMAVRTGGPGAAGLSVMVVPLKGYPGVSMRPIHVSGSKTSGTTYIELDDVKVPVENLIGREGDGMRIIMTNFNHERLTISVQCTRQARVALSAAFGYCMKREAFGKTLMDQPVVRHRLAKAGAELETVSAWVEQILYQLSKLEKKEADRLLGGVTAMAKAKAAMVLNECAQCAVLLFGGAGLTQSGQGELVEAIMRDVPVARIPGGSEDVLLDLAVRQLVKIYQTQEKKLGQAKI
ncbi:putative acyl-CoA dehydrogenase [Aspergillus nomiae NRRL 13137]|uniref:Putative acyl-CoA dehydrogenase n=1 Tax=Aspergillus nomiae NRRL (strain ATCC 15546 / NRRL 13137 / CBS 260.88 / M93) TaxID=1509407 RepID=A0A0L1JAL7_ASPN3|nr:putative acyl-CoA dehydrogenase [Aspergillus nomiae NRRL 13137]KNG88750.1 putative acyl-CoA dehydrogenase [Aspergillus nomiae NRRL 13137]